MATLRKLATTILFVVTTVVGVSSCVDEMESTFVGFEEGFIYNEPAQSLNYESVNHVGHFDTTENRLFTVEQYVEGNIVLRKGEEVIGQESFGYDLNLEATFEATPRVLYVLNEEKLSKVSMLSETTGDVSEEVTVDGDFNLVSVSKEYEFNFDEGEKVEVRSVYERLTHKSKEFAYTEIKGVSYKRYESKLNELKSNADSTVCDINLYFEVELRELGNSESSMYEVRVPIVRIYRKEKLPEPDRFETVMENVGYEGEFDTIAKELFTVKQQVNGEFVTYKNEADEVSRERFERNINLEAIFTVPEIVYVDSEEKLSEVKLAGSSKDGDKQNIKNSGAFKTTTLSMNYNFRFNEGERVVSATEFEKEAYENQDFVYTSIKNVKYSRYEAKRNEFKSSVDSTVYDVVLYFDVEVRREETVETKSNNLETYSVMVPYERVLMHEDVLVGKTYKDVKREIISNNTEKVSFTEYEIWSNSGEKKGKEISKVLSYGFESPEEQLIYSKTSSFETVSRGSVEENETSNSEGNWHISTKSYRYASTAENGYDQFENVYSYFSQKAVYKNEYYEVEFGYGQWEVSEHEATITKSGEETHNDTIYEVYPYINRVNYVYDVSSDKKEGTGTSKVKICVEKPVSKILPPSWGKIIGAGISAVPSDDVVSNYAKKCICIRTDKGAVSVAFEMQTKVPSVEVIQSGNFVTGTYGAEYNSGFYNNGKWEPAEAKDLGDRIAYYQNGNIVRNVRNTTLQVWGWRNGNLSTVVDGYSFLVSDDGVLTVKYNGAIVLKLR